MLIFATVFGIGFLLLIISALFGGDGDIDVDTDAVDLDTDHGPGFLNMKMLSVAMVGFGATGFAFRATTDFTMMQSSMAGLGGAVVMGILGYFILRAFYTAQGSSIVSREEVIGSQGHLIDAIPEKGNGQISCVVKGREITFLARSASGEPIPRGTPVEVIAKSGSVVTVRPTED